MKRHIAAITVGHLVFLPLLTAFASMLLLPFTAAYVIACWITPVMIGKLD